MPTRILEICGTSSLRSLNPRGECQPSKSPTPSAVFFMPYHLRSSELGSGSGGIKKPGYCRAFA